MQSKNKKRTKSASKKKDAERAYSCYSDGLSKLSECVSLLDLIGETKNSRKIWKKVEQLSKLSREIYELKHNVSE